jgi:hypothetical protein
LFWVAAMGWAHDAPPQVRVQVQLRTTPTTMRALVRIPLEAVRDVAFPEVAGGYLDVEKTAPLLPGLAKIWVADWLKVYEDGSAVAAPRVVATQISILSDRSFGVFESAEARLRAPLPENSERLFWKQVFFDVELAYAIRSAESGFAIRPDFANLGERVDTVVHFRDRTFLVAGDQEVFPLDPSWFQAAWLFVRLGFIHILEGVDHLLFLLCLVIPNRRFLALVGVATAFTAAHSLTLIASALGMTLDALWFPPLVEFVIAASIVYMALANIVGGGGHGSWMLAFGFGLVHGFGFSFALRESMQFAGSHLLTSLLSFNVGVELGQLFALCLMVPAVVGVFRYVVAERMGTIILSALIAHTGWHWMWERGEQLRKYTFSAPVINAAFLAMTLRWLMVLMLIYGAYWAIRRWRAS